MIYYNLNIVWIILCYATACRGWKAIPANQASYALRVPQVADQEKIKAAEKAEELADLALPRDQLNFIYKFGQCEAHVTRPQYLKKTVKFTLPTWQSTQLQYIYLLARKDTINHEMQCIVMRTLVAKKFLFKKSRLPMYYCQGTVMLLMLNTVNRFQIHEFYLHHRLNVPLDFVFEFYHPPIAG